MPRHEIIPEWHATCGETRMFVTVEKTHAEDMPATRIHVSQGTLDARCYLSPSELREFCRAGLAVADEVDPPKPDPLGPRPIPGVWGRSIAADLARRASIDAQLPEAVRKISDAYIETGPESPRLEHTISEAVKLADQLTGGSNNENPIDSEPAKPSDPSKRNGIVISQTVALPAWQWPVVWSADWNLRLAFPDLEAEIVLGEVVRQLKGPVYPRSRVLLSIIPPGWDKPCRCGILKARECECDEDNLHRPVKSGVRCATCGHGPIVHAPGCHERGCDCRGFKAPVPPPPSPSPTALRQAFGPGFVGGPGIVGQRDEDTR